MQLSLGDKTDIAADGDLSEIDFAAVAYLKVPTMEKNLDIQRDAPPIERDSSSLINVNFPGNSIDGVHHPRVPTKEVPEEIEKEPSAMQECRKCQTTCESTVSRHSCQSMQAHAKCGKFKPKQLARRVVHKPMYAASNMLTDFVPANHSPYQ